jgi:hypothetical protein
MGKYLDLLIVRTNYPRCDKSDISDKSPPLGKAGNDFGRFCRFGRILQELERRCPDYIDVADWQLAVADGRVFLGSRGASKPKRWDGPGATYSGLPRSRSAWSRTTAACRAMTSRASCGS